MSLKVAPVTALIQQPQTNDKYMVFIPDLFSTMWLGSETTLPFESRGKLDVPVPGTSIPMPGRLTNGNGEWTVTLTENFIPYVATQLQIAKRKEVFDELRNGHAHQFTFVNIFITDSLTGLVPLYWYTLHNVWIKRVEPLTLNWSSVEAQRFRVTFAYSHVKRSYLDDRRKAGTPAS